MRYLAIILGLAMLGYFAYTNFFKAAPPAPPPEPPPEPPAVLSQPPPPVLDREALERVRTATKDSDASVRWEAIQFLVQARDPRADALLYEALHRDSDSMIRRNIVSILEKREGPVVTRHLIQALRDTDVEVRLAVLSALGNVGDYSAAPHIAAAIRDTNEAVRLQALRTLKILEAKRAKTIDAARKEHEEATKKWEEEMKRRQEAQKKGR